MVRTSILRWPEVKLLVHRGETTALVLPHDEIQIYSGGREKPLRIMAVNPRTGQAHLEEGAGKGEDAGLDELSRLPEAEAMLEEGKALLAAGNYAWPEEETGKLHEWLSDLFQRERVNREDLRDGDQVALIWKFPVPARYPVKEEERTMRAECLQLGPFKTEDSENWSVLWYESRRDPNLGAGVVVSEQENRKEASVSSRQPTPSTRVSDWTEIVRLEEGETRWLGLLARFPSRRYLAVHRDLLRADQFADQEDADPFPGNRDVLGTVFL